MSDMTVTPELERPPAWGLWTTLAWVLAVFIVSQAITIVALMLLDRPAAFMGGAGDGRLLALSTLIGIPIQVAMLAFAARCRRWPVNEYLALGWPPRREVVLALVWLVVVGAGLNAVMYLAGHDIVTPWQIEAYRSAQAAGWLPHLFVAVVLFAPVGEEIAFRGFLYRGLARPGREVMAIVLIALAWAVIHIQYDWAGILQVFVIGLLLGWVRWRSGSTALPILMHILFNAEATIETVIAVEYLK
jgi:membrane protease YdiL (CAAX protease family)